MSRGAYQRATRCSTIDVHELLRREMVAQGVDSGGSRQFQPTTNDSGGVVAAPAVAPEYGFEDLEFHFDSVDKDVTSNPANGEISWNINALNNLQDIRNVVEMKIGSFYVPRIVASDTQPDYFFFRKVYMQVLNLPTTQAIIGNAAQYHFEFDVNNINSVAVQLVPTKNTFYFQRPVQSLSIFQVRFMIPVGFKRMMLPQDTFTVTSVANSNPAQFVLNNATTDVLATPAGPQPAPGIAVYFTGSLNPLIDQPAGLFITNIPSDVVFEVGSVNLTGQPAVTATMLVARNRVAFPMRFTCLRDGATNRITNTHV